MRFSLNVYKNGSSSVKFETISNLFAPNTIDLCFANDSKKDIPGIKNNFGNWNTDGHKARVITITKNELETFAKLFDNND